jgi:GGDEF domain-containing protein
LIRVADHRSGGSTQQLTAIVRAGLRRSDRLCRLEGSELLIVAPDTAPETAGVLAGELRRQLERVEADSESVAIEVLAPNGETAADLLARVTRSNGGSHPAEPSG